MTFHVGQKVATICAWMPRSYVPHMPQMGVVYRIREIINNSNDGGLLLEEIVNPVVTFPNGMVAEPRFNSAFFRPIVERETDISIFVRMLDPAREDA